MTTPVDPEKPIYKTRDIAAALGVTTQFVREQVAAGLFPCAFKQKGSRYYTYRFSLNDIRRYNTDAADRVLRGTAA